jgi:two-component system LytT family response regulator
MKSPDTTGCRRIRALIVDDENPARRRMSELLKAHPEVEIVGEASGVDEAVALLLTGRPDVIFLDIQMKPKSGFALLPHLSDLDGGVEVVFVTAFDSYALKAFEANALAYLTKPVRAARLVQTIDRLKKIAATRPVPAESREVFDETSCFELQDLIVLKDSTRKRIIRVGEIHFVQAEGHFTRIGLPCDETFLKNRPMAYWESRLPGAHFVKLSRSLLVHASLIAQISSQGRNMSQVWFKNTRIPIAISRLETVRIRRFL